MIILIAISAMTKLMEPGYDSDKVTIIWATDDNPARREQIKLFKKMYPEYNLRIDPSNYSMDKIIVQSIAGVGPDIFDSFGATSLQIYVKSGIAWDITDELKRLGIDPFEMTWPVSHPNFIYNGRVYGLPTNAGSRVMLYNKDLFDEYKIPYPKAPWKWNDFLEIAKKLTIKDEKGKIKVYGMLSPWGYWDQFILQWGGNIYNEDGTKCIIYSKESIEAIQFIHDLIYKYKVSPTPTEESAMATQGGWGSGHLTLFASGKAAMTIGDRYWLCTLRDIKKIRMGAVESPYHTRRVSLGGSRVSIINKNSPKREDALKFMIYLASKEYNKLINEQADWLAPIKDYCYTDEYLYNPKFPEEDYNIEFRNAIELAEPYPSTPFINGQLAARIIYLQLDLIKNNQKSVAEALKAIQDQINEGIQQTINLDPELKAEYDRRISLQNK